MDKTRTPNEPYQNPEGYASLPTKREEIFGSSNEAMVSESSSEIVTDHKA